MSTTDYLKLAALVAALMWPAGAIAGDNNAATSDVLAPNIVVPYDGYLALDNTPMNGQLNLRFELYDAASAGALLWTEDQSNVMFYNGRFSVGLGSVTPMTNVILDAEKVYLAIQIDDGTGTYFPLSGRQAIQPAPYSAWSANASDFNVAGNLTVKGTSSFEKTVTIKSEVHGDRLLRLDADRVWSFAQNGNGGNADLMLLDESATDSEFQVQSDGGFRVNSRSGSLELHVDPANNLTTVNGNQRVANGLTVNQNAQIDGNATVAGNLTVTGDITNIVRSTPYTVTGGNTKMISSANSICFLTRVRMSDIDAETANCFITTIAGDWWLQSDVSPGDATVECRAVCLSW